jgi:hypothetical protein
VTPLGNWLKNLRKGAPVIVVSGLPRSGTSMAMKMLEAGGMPLVVDGIRTADEDNPKGYYELERVKELDKGGDQGWVKGARGKAVKIISFLLKDLPGDSRYKIIFMHRDLSEVLASQAKMLERRGEKSQTDDGRMRDLYTRHLAKTKELLASDDRFEVLDLQYKHVIEMPGDAAHKIREFVGLPLDLEKMAQVADRGLYRNRGEGRD